MKNAVKGAALTAVAVGVVAGGAGAAFASSQATGSAADSPGVGSGNLGQVPVHVPVNVSGVTGNVIGLLNPAFGDTAVNEG
ncbi:chaplin [Streptacidiphilus monticola]|uniref:Chaplin n=1 Tax=Streptacidiphilus monticola TaxID=2161674 RepID=A0ABW1FXI7_9ACTN